MSISLSTIFRRELQGIMAIERRYLMKTKTIQNMKGIMISNLDMIGLILSPYMIIERRKKIMHKDI